MGLLHLGAEGGYFVMNLWVRKKQGLGVGVLEIYNDKPWSRGHIYSRLTGFDALLIDRIVYYKFRVIL